MAKITNPKLAFPFRLSGTGRKALVIEQDSDEEVISCVEVLLSTPRGSRVEVPDYGIPDQVFRRGGINREEIMSAIALWEGRANVILEPHDIEDMIQRVTAHFMGGPDA